MQASYNMITFSHSSVLNRNVSKVNKYDPTAFLFSKKKTLFVVAVPKQFFFTVILMLFIPFIYK